MKHELGGKIMTKFAHWDQKHKGIYQMIMMKIKQKPQKSLSQNENVSFKIKKLSRSKSTWKRPKKIK